MLTFTLTLTPIAHAHEFLTRGNLSSQRIQSTVVFLRANKNFISSWLCGS